MLSMPPPGLPRPMMRSVGPAVRAFRSRDLPLPGASGVMIGLLAWIASMIVPPLKRVGQ